MLTYLFAALVFLAATAALALGAILHRRPLQGSCGGLSSTGSCSLCGGKPEQCKK